MLRMVPGLRVLRQSVSTSVTRPLKPLTFRRNVVLARGKRTRGLLRDPEEVLASTNGPNKYGISEDNLEPVKGFLGSEYELPDALLLQVLTHKSFAHGSKPYNEKLAFLGDELLTLAASKYALRQEASSYQYSIGSVNFDSVGSLAQRLLVTDRILSQYAEKEGLDKVFFCKAPKGDKPKGIYSTIARSLVGAIALKHGKPAAEKFIDEKVWGELLPLVEAREQ